MCLDRDMRKHRLTCAKQFAKEEVAASALLTAACARRAIADCRKTAPSRGREEGQLLLIS